MTILFGHRSTLTSHQLSGLAIWLVRLLVSNHGTEPEGGLSDG